jgi:hypothetical protein
MANTLQQSIANIFTPNDGTSYVDGVLTSDSNNQAVDDSNAVVGNDGSIFTSNSDGGNSGNTNEKNTFQKIIGYTTPVGIIGKLAGWANGLSDDDASKKYGDMTVYTNEKGMNYAYNALGLPYEIAIVDGQAVDKLSIKDPETGLTGYQKLAQQARENGDNETAAAIEQEAAQNAGEVEGSGISKDAILQMIRDSGVAQSTQDIEAMVADPKGFLDARGINLSDVIPNLDPETAGTLLDPSNPNYMLSDLGDYTASLVTGVDPVSNPTAVDPQTYNTATTSDRMDNPQYNVDPATGQIRDANLVDASGYTIDMQGAATGVNADGTTNVTGEALNDYATQGMSQVIDTRTVSGKLMAQNLGEGNYIDSKATMTGQLEILSESFVDQNGNPKIPAFAQGQARAVARTMTFKGMTGTAATAAMATALMEASLPIAQQDSEFFKTLTIKNLDNRQQAIINKATVLSKFELANLSAREAAAVQNAKAFLEMDLTNLTNEQQAEVINTQAKVQALFEDTQQENANRRFTAETQNEFTKFYDELGVQVEQFNANLFAEIKRFNAGEINDATEFKQTMENQRQQFYAKMQYAVDEANARWRQTVATTNTEMAFDAAAVDVKNYLDLSQEGLNRMWDRTDATLDYLFKGALSEEEFELRLLLGEMNAQAQSSGGPSLFDTIISAGTQVAVAKYLKVT